MTIDDVLLMMAGTAAIATAAVSMGLLWTPLEETAVEVLVLAVAVMIAVMAPVVALVVAP